MIMGSEFCNDSWIVMEKVGEPVFPGGETGCLDVSCAAFCKLLGAVAAR